MTYTHETKELPKKYDHKEAEKRLQDSWYESGVYAWKDDKPKAKTFVIDTPPPTVSGLLHMGHVFSYTQADFIARFQRMSGKDVFYPMGFDDNGLPTERLVEKVKKVQAHRYISEHGREGFIELCEGVAEEARQDFRTLFKSIALSVDWEQEYHTISDDCRALSQLSFLDLYKKKHVTRKMEPMYWDPVDQTAIAQAELEEKELPSHFNDIIFGVADSDETFVIGTTRPEMIPACVAIFYHPEDTRYQHLKGKEAVTPLFGVRVPILEDETVEMDKGTGIMMCCTFGDDADVEKWKKHDLPLKLILNQYGKMDFSALRGGEGDAATSSNQTQEIATPAAQTRDDAIEALSNLKAKAAREKMIELLRESGDLVESKPITHSVKCAERSGAPIEILPTPQWFISVLDKKDALKEKMNACNWHPEFMKLRMEQWIDGLKWDWCISRQRYFGVPFPVWYSKREGEEGKMLIAEPDQLPCNPLVDLPKGYSREEVEAEKDVMDTWATSSISPQLSSKGISAEHALDSGRHSKLFPADMRPQAHEIIRTWAFYTIVKAHLHEDSVPWNNLMISGWCLAEDKTKMSKSKGNVVTPVSLIEEQGTDAVRYWASTSKLGTDTAFSTDLLKIGKKLVNKLWNATKFAAIHLDKLEAEPTTAAQAVSDGTVNEALDQWILTRLHRAISNATQSFEKYEYSKAREAVEDFFWNDFCDNYLELVKKRVYDEAGENPNAQMSAVVTIYHCLDGILRLFAPFVPHITEELHSHILPAKTAALGGSVHARGSWPQAADYPCDETSEASGIAAVQVLELIRKAKSEANVSIKFEIPSIEVTADAATLSPVLDDIRAAGNVSEIQISESIDGPTHTSEDGTYSANITIESTENSAA